MIRSIVLHGALKDEFGGPYPLDIASPSEAIRALCILIKGFKDRLREGRYAIVRGSMADGTAIKENALSMRLGGAGELHIVPVVQGGAWWIEALAGLAIVAAAFAAGPLLFGGAFAAGSIGAFAVNAAAGIGVSLALHGVSQLLAPSPQTNNADATQDQRQSFLFGGQTNVSSQGGPVPLIYGKMRVGSVIVSAGITTESLGVAGAFSTPGPS